jgi:hypothetical protein
MKRKKAHRIARKHINWWTCWLGLRWWSIEAIYVEHINTPEEGDLVRAECSADWRYLRATLCFAYDALINCTKKEIEHLVVHELCHVLINEIHHDDQLDHEERVVTTMTDAFLWVKEHAND